MGIANGMRTAGTVGMLAGVVTLAWAVAGGVTPAHADAVDDLAAAVARFRGIGERDVDAYVVTLTLPDEEEDAIVLLEAWSAPADLALGAADPGVPRAILRSWALFLEPMYVARTSLLGMDLEAGADRLRATARISLEETESGGSHIELRLAGEPDPGLPEMLRDVARLDAELGPRGRILHLTVELRADAMDTPDRIHLECTYDSARGGLPDVASWTLPDGQLVRVSTTFRMEGGRTVPDERYIVFPSRWDPGETEEILVRYGTYEFGRARVEERLRDRAPFRYDANGLVGD